MTDEVAIIRIIPEGMSGGTTDSGKVSTGGTANVAGAMKGVGGAIKGALNALGIGSVIGLIITIASSFKALMSMVGTILKMIGLLLKPIADVITVLLMPILFIIKPFVILVNQIMAPFIKLAMGVMREGAKSLKDGDIAGAATAFAGAGAIMMQGLNSVLIALSTQFMKMIVDIVFSVASKVVGVIVGIFGVSQETVDAKFKEGADKVKSGIDLIGAESSVLIAGLSVTIAEQFDVNTDKFKNSVVKNIFGLFDKADKESITGTMVKVLGVDFKKAGVDAIKNAITDDPDSVATTFVDAIGKFKDKGVNAVSSAVSAINTEWGKLKKGGSGGGSGRSFTTDEGSILNQELINVAILNQELINVIR